MALMIACLLSAEYRKSVGLHQSTKHRKETFALRNLFAPILFVFQEMEEHLGKAVL